MGKNLAGDNSPTIHPGGDGVRRHAPAAERNRGPILSVLKRLFTQTRSVLEIASGTGQHAAHCAPALPHLTWQPTETDPDLLASIAAWAVGSGAANLRPPVRLDVADWPWPVTKTDAVVCINLLHIAPWPVGQSMLRGAGAVLPPGGLLYLYGPFFVEGRAAGSGNAAFDTALRGRDPRLGVRTLEAVVGEAAAWGLDLSERIDMPADNLSVVFKRR
ncbi:MAG: DUF938 domain-containing protein [Inquilinaceae bacterium]